MTSPLADAWLTHLETVRWFGGKGAGARLIELQALPWWTPAEVLPRVRSEIATLAFGDGHHENYQLLVAHHTERPTTGAVLGTISDEAGAEVFVTDATTDPAALAAFVAATVPAHGDRPVAVWPGEQSNTTLTLGADDLYKLFRRIEPGPNLDAEVLVALKGVSVPQVRHRLVADWPEGIRSDLGIVIERVPQARDGWILASSACAEGRDFTAEAVGLGRALARVHAQLRETFGTSVVPGDRLAEVMTARLDHALAVAPVLDQYADGLRSRFAVLHGREVAVQRVHGDFHLGQALLGREGWTIIDFEGEPAKTAAERRAPDAVWRDVAGMLRSFDYARSAHADPSGASATAWARDSRRAFCEGYCGSTTPDDILGAYEVDKAVYEVLYELRNRPDWVDIPLTAVHTAAS
ncbi:MAG: maltokinase N-terminal cap-like domain-containing protein [Propioniciclava sp.]